MVLPTTFSATTTIFDLPPEILLLICDHLTAHDRAVCLRVCKVWYDSFSNDLFDTIAIYDITPDQITFCPSKSFNYGYWQKHCNGRSRSNGRGGGRGGCSGRGGRGGCNGRGGRGCYSGRMSGGVFHVHCEAAMTLSEASLIFFRNLHRIRVLTITSSVYASFVELYHRVSDNGAKDSVKKNSLGGGLSEGIIPITNGLEKQQEEGVIVERAPLHSLPSLRLQDLTIYSGGDHGSGLYRIPLSDNLQPFLDLLEQQPTSPSLKSSSLKRLRIKFWSTKEYGERKSRWRVEYLARILLALPSSLERLTIDFSEDDNASLNKFRPGYKEKDAASLKELLSNYHSLLPTTTATTATKSTTLFTSTKMTTITTTNTNLRVLNNLRALSLIGMESDMARVLIADPFLFSRSPAMEELLIRDESALLLRQENDISPLVAFMISSKKKPSILYPKGDINNDSTSNNSSIDPDVVGWKTIGLSCKNACGQKPMDSRIVEAILDCSPTLENLRISGCPAFPSVAIQKLLSSAARLKRLDVYGLPSKIHANYPINNHMLLAKDISPSLFIQNKYQKDQDQDKDEDHQSHAMKEDSNDKNVDWVCVGLQSFKCMIGGIPRPDVTTMTNGWSLLNSVDHLYGPDHYTVQDSQRIQRRILGQLGRLQRLEEITLGMDLAVDLYRCYDYCCSDTLAFLSDEEYCEKTGTVADSAHQYACLSLTLEDGLDLLGELKSLRLFQIDKLSHRLGVRERQWMKENWPVYGQPSRDTFWIKRGHVIELSEDDYDN